MPVFSSAEIEDGARFLKEEKEERIARKDPTAMPPRTECVAAEPAPNRGSADFGHSALGEDFLTDVGDREPGQQQAQAMRQFTGQSLYLDDETGGKAGFTPASGLCLEAG